MITYDYINEVVINRDFALLKEIKDALSNELEALDSFLDEYLQNNHLDMKKQSNNWILYKQKLNEYCEISDNLKTVNYFMEKYNV